MRIYTSKIQRPNAAASIFYRFFLLVLGKQKTTYSQMLTKKMVMNISWQKEKKQHNKNWSKSKILECLECFADFVTKPPGESSPQLTPKQKKNLPPETPWTPHETSAPW